MSRRSEFAAALSFVLSVGLLGATFAGAEEPVKSQNGLFPDEIVSAEDLRDQLARHDDFVLFDARNKQSFEEGHIDGARLPRTEDYYQQQELYRSGLSPKAPEDEAGALEKGTADIPKDKPIVTYCNSNCHAAAVLALALKKLGFTHVRAMEEGYQTWEKKGYPVVKKAPPAPSA